MRKNVPANGIKDVQGEFNSFVTWEKQNPTWTGYKDFFIPVTKPCLAIAWLIISFKQDSTSI